MSSQNSKALAVVDSPPLEVNTDLGARIITDEESEQILRAQGLVKVQADTMRQVSNLGIYSKSIGLLHQQRGTALVSQQRLDEIIRQLCEEFRKEAASSKKARMANMAKITQQIGYLAGKISESQRVMMDLIFGPPHVAGLNAPGRKMGTVVTEDEGPQRSSFSPGEDVMPANGGTLVVGREVHVHTQGPAPTGST